MRKDPEERERKAILKWGNFKNKLVLDIGCGSGTNQYFSSLTKRTVGVDPSVSLIKEANNQLPTNLKQKVNYLVGAGGTLSFTDETFELVFFSWSLHHIPIKSQKNALEEAYRVLKKNGQLLILEPTSAGERIHFTELGHPEIEQVNHVNELLSQLPEKLFRLENQETFIINYYFNNPDEVIEYFRDDDNLLPSKEAEALKLLKSCKKAKNEFLIREGAKILSLRKN